MQEDKTYVKRDHNLSFLKEVFVLSSTNEILNFLEDYSGVHPESADTDIFKDMGITGDDFHEMIDGYSKRYSVDMSEYLWYFHTNEEGSNCIGGYFFKPPYKRVTRIAVTPQMLADFIATKKWKIQYPEHDLPKQRTDLTINAVIFGALLLWALISIITRFAC